MSLTSHLLTSLANFSQIKSRKLEMCLSHPPSNPPKIIAFTQVSEDTVDRKIRNSSTKSYLLDLWPTFLIKVCSDIVLLSVTKMVNCSLMEGHVSDGFKTTPLIKMPPFPWII